VKWIGGSGKREIIGERASFRHAILLSYRRHFICMNSISYPAIVLSQRGFARRFLFPGFLIFSVCFYSYRFLLGMGSPLTTIYDSDAPEWLRVSKDVV
jgi:hypothetical protein